MNTLKRKIACGAVAVALGLYSTAALAYPNSFNRAISLPGIYNGQITAMASSPDRKTLYIGGSFDTSGTGRNRLAAIDVATGAFTPWNPDADGAIYAVAVSGNTVYVGGEFTTIGGQTRNRIAAIDATTGLPTSWNPNMGHTNPLLAPAASRVTAIAVSGNTVYAGGFFRTVGGQTRNRIAAIDATTGLPTPWNPNLSGSAFSIAVDGNTVYAAGGFTSVGGQTRNRIAAIDATTGLPTSWDPNVGGGIYSMTLSGNTVYIAGTFTSVGGQTRNKVAAIDASTGLPTSWDPNPNDTARIVVVRGNTVYVGGDFTSIGGQARNRLAGLDASTGLASSWNPETGDRVYSIAAILATDTTLYAAGTPLGGPDPVYPDFSSGYFAQFGPNAVQFSSAISSTPSGAVPAANGPIHAVAKSADESTLYVGGNFTTIGGAARNSLAAINVATGSVLDWNPNAGSDPNPNVNRSVYAIAVSGNTVYVGGEFSTIGGQTRKKIAAVDGTTGQVTPWDPNGIAYNGGAINSVRTLAISGSTLYVGGNFWVMGGRSQYGLAAFNTETGLLTPWRPVSGHYYTPFVSKLVVSGSTVIVAGPFEGRDASRLAAYSTDGIGYPLTSPYVDRDEGVSSIAVGESNVYIGGDFTYINSRSSVRNRLASFTKSNTIGIGGLTSWNPNANGSVDDILAYGSKVYVRGSFTSIGGQGRSGFAEIDAQGNATSWNPGTSAYPLTLVGSKLLTGSGYYDLTAADRSTAGESAGAVTLSVELREADQSPVTVNYATSNGTATAGSDYTATSGTLTWAAGETGVKTITINLSDDSMDEPDETILVTLSNPSHSLLGSQTLHTVTILDNDDPSPSAASTNNTQSRTASPSPVGNTDGGSQESGASTRPSPAVIDSSGDTGSNAKPAGTPYTVTCTNFKTGEDCGSASGSLAALQSNTANSDGTYTLTPDPDKILDPDDPSRISILITASLGTMTLKQYYGGNTLTQGGTIEAGTMDINTTLSSALLESQGEETGPSSFQPGCLNTLTNKDLFGGSSIDDTRTGAALATLRQSLSCVMARKIDPASFGGKSYSDVLARFMESQVKDAEIESMASSVAHYCGLTYDTTLLRLKEVRDTLATLRNFTAQVASDEATCADIESNPDAKEAWVATIKDLEPEVLREKESFQLMAESLTGFLETAREDKNYKPFQDMSQRRVILQAIQTNSGNLDQVVK